MIQGKSLYSSVLRGQARCCETLCSSHVMLCADPPPSLPASEQGHTCLSGSSFTYMRNAGFGNSD